MKGKIALNDNNPENKGGSKTMKMTSAQAAKELRKRNDQHDALLAKENKSREFVAAIQEDVEAIRPAYDYLKIQEELDKGSDSELLKDFIKLYGDEKDEAYETCHAIWNSIYEILNKEISARNEDK